MAYRVAEPWTEAWLRNQGQNLYFTRKTYYLTPVGRYVFMLGTLSLELLMVVDTDRYIWIHFTEIHSSRLSTGGGINTGQ